MLTISGRVNKDEFLASKKTKRIISLGNEDGVSWMKAKRLYRSGLVGDEIDISRGILGSLWEEDDLDMVKDFHEYCCVWENIKSERALGTDAVRDWE